MSTSDEPRRQILQQMLEGNACMDSNEVIRVALQQWRMLATKFSNLLGTDGVRLIYARSLQLNKGAFP